jgi:hypothetical protein
LKCQGIKGSKGIKGKRIEKISTIKLSIEKLFNVEVKLGFGGRIQNAKELEFQRG